MCAFMLPESLQYPIAALGRRLGAERVVLFGSRARGDERPRSDVDLAVFGLSAQQEAPFWNGIDELPTLLSFDIVFVSPRTSPALLENIEKDGIVLMDKFQEKLSKFEQAVTRLDEVIAVYDQYKLPELKDAVIQRFSFCSELAWKSVREYLLDEGYLDLNSPKAVMRQAYAAGLLADDLPWIELLKARNLAAHVYDEATANDIFTQVRADFVPLFHDLLQKLKQEA